MKELQIFKNEEFGEVRIVERDGEPWFVGKDVAEALGYANTRDALAKHVDEEDKNTVAICDGNKGNPNQTLVNESGLYSLVMSSKLPEAKKFKRWVTHEVLPAIRKTGSYTTKGMTDYQQMMAQTRQHNVAVQKARILNQIASQYEGAYRQVLQAYATKELTGEFLLPLPKVEKRTYSAAEIGSKLGISANKVGKMTNQHGLKTEEYGIWCADKSRFSDKQVESFRYYDEIVPQLAKLLHSVQSV